jgi:ankyrin repeat protein
MHRSVLLIFAASVGLCAGDVNEDLLEAAHTGDLSAVQALIGKGAALETKTAYGQTPLYLAAMNGREEVVRFLLDKGANPDVHDSFYHASMLDFVLMRKHYGVAKMLIRKGTANPDRILATVAEAGNADLVEALLEAGKPSQPALDKTYEAALSEKQTDVAALLKKAGAHEPAPAFVVDAKTLEVYAGTYKSDQIPLDIKASTKEGRLYFQATGQPEFALKPKSATQFEFAPAQVEVEFDSPSSFTLKQGGGSYHFKKAVAQ